MNEPVQVLTSLYRSAARLRSRRAAGAKGLDEREH